VGAKNNEIPRRLAVDCDDTGELEKSLGIGENTGKKEG
jgi:hypothetical protein